MENKYIYQVSDQVLSRDLLIASYGAFLSDVVSKIEDKDKTIAFFVVLQGQIGYRNLTGKIQVKVKDIQVIQDNIQSIFELKEDYYNELSIDNLIYSYTVFDVGVITKHDSLKEILPRKPFTRRIRIGKFSIPKTSNLKEWGQVHYIRNDKEALIFKYNSKGVYHVKFLSDQERLIKLKLKGKVQLTFTDTLLSENDPLNFKREYGSTTIYFKNGKVLFEVKKFFIRYIRPSKSRFYKCNFLTMDLETLNKDGTLIPYAISIYDGLDKTFFYLSDYDNLNHMMEEAIISLMQRKYNGYAVYLHNFSKFDGVFLLRHLSNLSNNIKFICRAGEFINISFTFGRYRLYFRDSLLMLPGSLSKLSKSFYVEDKGIFPHSFVRVSNLNYNGNVPDIEYFTGITEEQYQEYCIAYTDKNWNLREEVEKYLLKDSIILYEVLSTFNKLVYETFDVNISKYPTLSSLSFGIFRSRYLSKNKICLLDGDVYKYIYIFNTYTF